MRLLADENFPKPIVDNLRSAGQDVLWVRTHYPGRKDFALIDLAEVEKRILITFDKDFWQISLQHKGPLEHAGVVLLRIHPPTSDNISPPINAFLRADKIWAGHMRIMPAFRC